MATTDQYQREEKFQQAVKQIVAGFEKQRKDLLDLVDSDNFKENVFGNYVALKTQLEELNRSLIENHEQQHRFRELRAQAESIAQQLNVEYS